MGGAVGLEDAVIVFALTFHQHAFNRMVLLHRTAHCHKGDTRGSFCLSFLLVKFGFKKKFSFNYTQGYTGRCK